MMSQISVNPVANAAIGNDPAAKPTRAPVQDSGGSGGGTAGGDAGTDTVTLSAAAQAGGGTNAPSSDLTDAEAASTAVTLRQQLGSQTLSAGARQNQSILSLLRS
jgi:hypothetical protein